jgi:CRP/FNR family transcriptional regulator, cyclic AMP receptor protein
MRKVLFILGQLSDSDMEWMLSAGTKESVASGNILIHEGKAIDFVYIVLDGKLSVSAAALGNKEVAALGSGEIVGEMSFIDARPPSATVKAREDSIVFAIPRSVLASKLEKDVAFAARFYHALAVFLSDRLRSTVSRLGYSDGASLDEEMEYEDELDPSVLDTVHLAGSRFDRMLKRLMGT